MINYKYCPQCKNDLDLSGEYPYCPHCRLTIYRNSKPCAGVLPIKNGRVLLSRRGVDPYKGDWDTIGGFLNSGEHPQTGALREALEETGLKMKITGLLGIYIDKYGPNGDDVQGTVYLTEITGGKMKAQDDVASLEWVDIKTGKITSHFKSIEKVFADLTKLFS